MALGRRGQRGRGQTQADKKRHHTKWLITVLVGGHDGHKKMGEFKVPSKQTDWTKKQDQSQDPGFAKHHPYTYVKLRPAHSSLHVCYLVNLLPANLQKQLVKDGAVVDLSVSVPGEIEVGPAAHRADGCPVDGLGNHQHCFLINAICQQEMIMGIIGIMLASFIRKYGLIEKIGVRLVCGGGVGVGGRNTDATGGRGWEGKGLI